MSGRIRLFWVVLTALFAALAVLACVYSSLFGSIWNRPEGDPAETVTWFFDSIRIGNYPSAYSCLSDYVTLGLEQEPETPEAKKIYDVLNDFIHNGGLKKCLENTITHSIGNGAEFIADYVKEHI